MTPTELYIWTRLDSWDITATVVCVFGTMAFIALWVWNEHLKHVSEKGEERSHFSMTKGEAIEIRKYVKKVLTAVSVATVFGWLGVLFLPNKTDIAMIYGLHWATNNENVQAIPDEAAQVLREWLEEARPNKGEKP